LAAARRTFRSLCAVSLRHRPNATFSKVEDLQDQSQTTTRPLDVCEGRVGASSCRRLGGVMIEASPPIGLSLAYIPWDGSDLQTLFIPDGDP
jgi:hypothetical protein